MKSIKTLALALMAMLAIGAASCNKDKTSDKANDSTACTLDSIMAVAVTGEVAVLDCDTIMHADTKFETPVVLCFIAENAPTCAPLTEPLAKLAADNEGNLAVITADLAACPATAAAFDVEYVPTVVVFYPGSEPQTYAGLDTFLDADLAKKSVEEQAQGIYDKLLFYSGINDPED